MADEFHYSHLLPKKPPVDIAFGDAATLLTKTCKRCGVEFETRIRPKKRCDACQDASKAGHVPSTTDSRVDVFVPSGRINVRCPEERLGWRCGVCGRGIVAKRLTGNRLDYHQKCPVCHVAVKVVEHTSRPVPHGFHPHAFALVSRPATLEDAERICKELGV